MKKAVLFVVALILLSVITNAQKSTGGKAFDENTRIINLGVGPVLSYYKFSKGNGHSYRNNPAISVSYEQPWKEKVGPGYLGIGAFLSFQSTKYRYEHTSWKGNFDYYEHKYKNYVVAGRMVYHWDGLNFENAEVYGGAIIGLRIQTYNYSTNSTDPELLYVARDSDVAIRPTASVFAGARWYFVPKVAVFGEASAGYGVPYITIGVSFKI